MCKKVFRTHGRKERNGQKDLIVEPIKEGNKKKRNNHK